MTTIFRTFVFDLPPTPLGMLPRRWAIEHDCMLCQRKVATEALIEHAQAHAAAITDGSRLQSVP